MKNRIVAMVFLAVAAFLPQAKAGRIYDFEGQCSGGCTGTAKGVLELADSHEPGAQLTPADFVSFQYEGIYYDILVNPLHGLLPPATGPTVEWVEVDGVGSGTGLNACGSTAGIPNDFFCPTAHFWSFEWLPAGIERDFGPSHSWTLRPVPQPATVALFGIGVAGLGFWRRRSRV